MEISPFLLAATGVANALIAAGVAVAVARLTHKYTAERETRREQDAAERHRREFLRDKLERLVELVGEHYEQCGHSARQFGSALLSWAHGQQNDDPAIWPSVVPLYRAYAIQRLYFPELAGQLEDVRSATSKYLGFLNGEFASFAEMGKDAWLDQRKGQYAKESVEALAPVCDGHVDLASKARQLIETQLAP